MLKTMIAPSLSPSPSPVPHIPELPLEITDLIIDHLFLQNDKRSLHTLSLSSSLFTPHAQKLLFHTIDLSDRCIPGETYFRRLYTFLLFHPHFRGYVKNLRLVDTYVWDRKSDWTWVTREDTIVDLLGWLDGLERFEVRLNIGTPRWGDFSGCLRRGFMEVVGREKVRYVSLGRIRDFPPTLCVQLAAAKRLELDGLGVLDNTYLPSSLGVVLNMAVIPRPRLEMLVLKHVKTPIVHVLRNILALYPQPTMRCLKVTIGEVRDGVEGEEDREMVRELWAIMMWARESLEEIEWRSPTRPKLSAMVPPHPITLSVFPNLKTLHFHVNFHAEDQPVFTQLLVLLNQLVHNSNTDSNSNLHVSRNSQDLDDVDNAGHFEFCNCSDRHSSDGRDCSEEWGPRECTGDGEEGRERCVRSERGDVRKETTNYMHENVNRKESSPDRIVDTNVQPNSNIQQNAWSYSPYLRAHTDTHPHSGNVTGGTDGTGWTGQKVDRNGNGISMGGTGSRTSRGLALETLIIECMFLKPEELLAVRHGTGPGQVNGWKILDELLSSFYSNCRSGYGASSGYVSKVNSTSAYPYPRHYPRPLNSFDHEHNIDIKVTSPATQKYKYKYTFPHLHTIIFHARLKSTSHMRTAAKRILEGALPRTQARGVRVGVRWDGS